MIAIFLLAFTLSLFSFGTTPAAAGDVAGVSTHLFLTVLRDYDHDAAFSVTYTDALGTHTKPYHAGMEVTAWSPVTITCTNHHVYDWSIDADVQEATIVGVGGITYPGGTGIHVKGTNTIKAFATNFGLHYINIVVILGEGNDNGGDNGGNNRGEKAAPQKTTDVVVMCESVTDASQAREIAAKLTKERYVNLMTEPDLSGIAVDTEDTSYLFSGDAVQDNDFMSTLFSASIKKVTHDCKPLMRVLLERGLPADGFIFDTALAAYDLDATRGEYQLDDVFSQYCGAQIGYVDAQQVGQEAAREAALRAQAAAVAALYEVLPGRIREAGMEKLYYEIELPLCLCLARMETQGVLVDQMALIRFGNMLTGGIEHDQEEIFRYAGQEFNINSPKQLGEILFEKLELPPVKKTKSGYSTNAEVLEKLKNRHPIIEAILDYRTLTKLKSTYADGLVKEIAGDGRIHTTFQNMVTATGRLSSTEPNLQNIPVRTELGSEIRKMFVPQDGCVFVDADYSQIELRVLAHIAQDQHMQEAFTSGMDIHTATAAQVFHVAPEDVTPLMRRHAKAVNFGIVYGISEFSLAEDIGVTRKEAKAYIDRYLENYAGVRAYMKDIVAKAKQDGFVTTLFGRRRNLPELKSSNFNIRSFGERVALNTPIQGTAADIIKLAMLHVDRALRERKLQARLVLQVHDELIVECPVEERVQVTQLLTEQMQQVAKLSVPLLAEAKSGASWYEAK